MSSKKDQIIESIARALCELDVVIDDSYFKDPNVTRKLYVEQNYRKYIGKASTVYYVAKR